jgi:hypothetical protein
MSTKNQYNLLNDGGDPMLTIGMFCAMKYGRSHLPIIT